MARSDADVSPGNQTDMSDDEIEDDDNHEIDELQDSDGSDLNELLKNPKKLAECLNEEVHSKLKQSDGCCAD